MSLTSELVDSPYHATVFSASVPEVAELFCTTEARFKPSLVGSGVSPSKPQLRLLMGEATMRRVLTAATLIQA
jgi:hypothetical protein